jgi:hypothetical protein
LGGKAGIFSMMTFLGGASLGGATKLIILCGTWIGGSGGASLIINGSGVSGLGACCLII